MGPAHDGYNDRGGISLGRTVPDSSALLPERRQESDAFIRCLPEISCRVTTTRETLLV